MRSASTHPSLRRQLLKTVALPLFVLVCVCAALPYELGKRYANHLHDQSLVENAQSVMELLRRYPEARRGIAQQVQFLIQYDVDGAQYFEVKSTLHGRSGGNFHPPANLRLPVPGGPARLQYTGGPTPLRLATVAFHPPLQPEDTVTVTVGETLDDRQAWARQILFITLPALALMLLGMGILVSSGIRAGLRILEPLGERLRAQQGSLDPLVVDDVPVEVMPFAETINELLSRLRESVGLQHRFIADAAHQLRTPLAGLALQVRRFTHGAAEEHADAAAQVQRLTARTSRIADQLLVLARVQADAARDPTPVDLARSVPALVRFRVGEALRAGIDLGYQAPPHADEPHVVALTQDALENALDNLIDNALRHAAAWVTVQVDGDTSNCYVRVDDDGPGVAADDLARLGARFFRVAGSPGVGSGLGLSIVEEIVDQAGGDVTYTASPGAGLRVTLRLPRQPRRKGGETPANDDGPRSTDIGAGCDPTNSSCMAAPTASSSSTA